MDQHSHLPSRAPPRNLQLCNLHAYHFKINYAFTLSVGAMGFVFNQKYFVKKLRRILLIYKIYMSTLYANKVLVEFSFTKTP